MDRRNKLRLLLITVLIFILLFLTCFLLLIRGADRHFMSSSEIISSQIENLIEANESEKNDLQASLKEEYISRARSLAYILGENSALQEDYDGFCRLAELLNIDEINIFGTDGLIAYSTVPEYVGFSIYSGGQVAFFEPMMSDRSLALCQDMTPNTKEGKLVMYAAVWCADGERLVQIGISPERLLAAQEKNDISAVLNRLPLENSLYFIYDTGTDRVVSSTREDFFGLSGSEMRFDLNSVSGRLIRIGPDGEGYICVLTDYGRYRIGVCEATSHLYRDANSSAVLFAAFIALCLTGFYILINVLTDRRMKEEEKLIGELTEVTDQLSGYKRAVLSDALISLEANLSRDALYYGVWKDRAGNEVPPEKVLGRPLPCSYDGYIRQWNDRFVRRKENGPYVTGSEREGLLRAFGEGKTEVTFDYEAKTIDGEDKWLRRSICMTRNSAGDVIAYTSVKDISELVGRQKREEEIVQSLAAEYDSIAVVSLNEDERNDRVTVHSRITPKIAALIDDETANEECYGRKLHLFAHFIHPDDRERYTASIRRERILRSLEKGETHTVDFRVLKKGDAGEYVYFRMRFVPLCSADGALTGMIACMRDMDDEVRREKEERRRLEEAMIAAEAANRAKSTFLFNMSHDIRTPMNAILGFTDIAEKNIGDRERVLDALNKVKLAGGHLLSLINDVLDMSRVESGQVKTEEEPIRIDTVKDSLHSLLAGSAQEKGLVFTSALDPSVTHHWFLADRLRMMRVLTNIVSNSVKYTEPGGRIALLAEELPCEREGWARYRYTVSDTGIGMSKEYLAHVFEPFTRAESATRSGVTGTGLGMAITKSLVELMGGAIRVESEPGVGTTVTVEFENRITEPVETGENGPEAVSAGLAGKRVLLAEDNEMNREIACEILHEAGVEVDTAQDGDIAVEKLRNAPAGRWDLILMDIQMPRMNGYEATRAIRALPGTYAATVPIFAMTANAFEEDKQDALAAGMNGHLAKPIDVSKLLATIAACK